MRDIDQNGIYKITNLVTGKFYLGSTANKLGFKERWRTHKVALNAGRHCNPHLQRAWNKYGKESFAFEIIEICSKEDCIKNEQKYLDELKSYNPEVGYNLCKTAGNTLGRKHSVETRKKIGQRKYNKPWNTGKSWSKEQKKKLSEAQKNSEIAKKKLAKLNKSKRKPVIGTNIKTEEVIKLDFINQDPNFFAYGIKQCILGKIKQYKGYTWKWAN